VQFLAIGESPVGVIAIGQVPTGIIAIGQAATGVIAIGQLSRGVIAIGQLALGVFALGQLGIGVAWAGGMLAVGGVRGPAMLGYGAFGRMPLRALLHGRWQFFERRPFEGRRVVLAAACAVMVLIAALAWWAAFAPLIHELTRHEPQQPRELR